MIEVKLNYIMKGTQHEETVECLNFNASSIAACLERNIEEQTGVDTTVDVLHERWTEGDVLLFSFDVGEEDVMSGYAYQSRVNKYVFGIWFDGYDEMEDPDELYETHEADEPAAYMYFISTFDMDHTAMMRATVKLISVQS